MSSKINGENILPRNGDLRDCIKISIENLIKLHYGETCEVDFIKSKEKNEQENEKIINQATKELANNIFNGNDKHYRNYVSYIGFYLDSEKIHNFNEIYAIKNHTEYEEIIKHIKSLKKMKAEELLEKTQEYISLKGANYNIDYIPDALNIIKLNENQDFKNIKEIKNVLKGIWFERYFYLAMLEAKKRLKEQQNIDIEIGWSCKVKPKIENGKDFEIDIVASRGYSLYVFSLTIDNNQGISKSKFFEVVYRTNQMSGEFGKVTMVTFLDESDDKAKKEVAKFRKDLESFSTNIYSNAEIWGNSQVNDEEKLIQNIMNRIGK